MSHGLIKTFLPPLLLLLTGNAFAQGGVLSYCHQPITVPGVKQIAVINADGTDDTVLTSSAIGLNYPDWSPDGAKIAVGGYVSDLTWSLYSLDADGGNLVRLTTMTNVQDAEPDWSPDGSQIVFARRYPADPNREELWIVNADGSDPAFTGIMGSAPQWSPDGERLLYHLLEDDLFQIRVCRVDGSEVITLASSSAHEMLPSWSPDGSRIAFTSLRDGNPEIYVMNADGSQQERLTSNSVDDYAAAWSPDGSLIAWCSGLAGAQQWEIYLMHDDGSSQTRLTTSSAGTTAINPDWKPQRLEYLGQPPPGLVPVRFPPDSLCANSDWFWHGTPIFSADLKQMFWSKYTIHPTYQRTELAFVEVRYNQWTSLQAPAFANPDYSENNPVFWAGDDTLFFRSDRPGGKIFWVARTESGWSEPEPVSIPMPPGLSMGNQFGMAGNRALYFELSDGFDYDIYRSEFAGGGYQTPVLQSGVNSGSYDWGPYVDPDERFLIFTSFRPGGFGMHDLYICIRNADKTWDTPVNLGSTINTAAEEAFPTISPDGLYFFFQTEHAGDAGYNPYWVDAQIIYDFLPPETAVALQHQDAFFLGDRIEISWRLSEPGSDVIFEITRAESPGTSYRSVPGLRVEGNELSFKACDTDFETGKTYRYRIECRRANRRWLLFETEPIAIPDVSLTLHQNVPNPFNPGTEIRYDLPAAGKVTVDVFDVAGRLVARLVDGLEKEGPHRLTWNGRDRQQRLVPSGAYFCRLRTDQGTRALRMTLIR